MEERDNKTIVCSVLFMDIVEYSQKAVSGQISLKEGFNVFLSTALEDIPVTDRIILDTGDGAAISFLGDIEDALKVGLSMRQSLLSAGMYMDPPLLVRMGINLGPVRLVKDINNQPNIVGDGINVAQRVMGFADVGQLLVSRSYYDAVSRISQEYAGMFHYQGSRTDKHVREHQVYAIGYPGEFTLAKKLSTFQGMLAQLPLQLRSSIAIRFALMSNSFQKFSLRQKLLFVVIPLLLVVSLVAGLSVWKQSTVTPTKQVVVRYYPDAAQANSSVNALTVKKAETGERVVVVKESVKVESIKKSDSAKKVESVKKDEKASVSKGRTLDEAAGRTAVVSLVVLPWGEIYLDGRMMGFSPPLKQLNVPPGKHEIEIRNANFPVFKQTIQTKVGEKLKINHTFTN
jgi:class 3 adenylate cyclase